MAKIKQISVYSANQGQITGQWINYDIGAKAENITFQAGSNTITNVQDQITGLKSDIGTLGSSVSTLNDDLTSAKNNSLLKDSGRATQQTNGTIELRQTFKINDKPQSNLQGKGINFKDSNNKFMGAVEPYNITDGKIRVRVGTFLDSSYNNDKKVDHWLNMDIDPSGVRSVGVSDPAAWRSGLGVPPKSHAVNANTYGWGTTGVYGHVKLVDSLNGGAATSGLVLSANQGKALNDRLKVVEGNDAPHRYSTNDVVTAGSGHWTRSKYGVTLTAGAWIITLHGHFSKNGNGHREITLVTNSSKAVPNSASSISDYGEGWTSYVSCVPISTQVTRMCDTFYYTTNKTVKAYVMGYQNSGTDLNFYGVLEVKKVSSSTASVAEKVV